MTRAPELEPHCGSWVVTTANGRVFETYSRALADYCAANASTTVETAAQYLARLNQSIKRINP